jgi:nucleoside-diphosphate-sugar epimerase
VDNFDPYYNRAIKENNISEHRTHDNYRLVEEDNRNLDALRSKITEDIDVIVHMATKAGVRLAPAAGPGHPQIPAADEQR